MHHIEIISRLEGPHLEPVEELIQAATKADGHEPVGEHKFLRLQRGDDLGIAFLALEDEHIVGYAHTMTYGHGAARRVSCELVVRPEFRRTGIGGRLMSSVLLHAQGHGAHQLNVWAYNNPPAGRRMAEAHGLRPTRSLLHMVRNVDEAEAVADPPGAEMRTFRPGADDEAWLSLNNRIFAHHPENGDWTPDDLRARMDQPWFRPDDVLMLEIEAELAGFCWLKIEERPEGSVGEIYVIGAAPDRQRHGLGRFLISRALQHLEDRRVGTVAAYVDETNSPAVALYDSFGFNHHHMDVCYSLDLPPGPE
jgi:mycothiol synthase